MNEIKEIFIWQKLRDEMGENFKPPIESRVVGRKFIIVNSVNPVSNETTGDVVTLVYDDNTLCPYFSGPGCTRVPINWHELGLYHG